jgi:hypothetical protein
MRIGPTLALLALMLAACGPSGPAQSDKAGGPSTARAGRALPTGPMLPGVGVIASLQGKTLTLDHEAVEGGLPAGRHAFVADAALLAEGPLEPGARVAFTYQDWTPQPLLTGLKAR